MKIGVTVDGFAGLDKQIKSIQRAAADALEGLATNGAIIVESAAKENLIANGSVVTGTLMRSIHHETVEKKTTSVTVAAGPDTPYAARLEFGFVGVDSLGRHYNQGPKPYMRPAFDTNKDKITAEMAANIRETISDALFDEVQDRASRRRGKL